MPRPSHHPWIEREKGKKNDKEHKEWRDTKINNIRMGTQKE
jgi:hypothetical protein